MKRMASAKKKSNGRGTSIKGDTVPRRRASAFVVCIENAHYAASLERHKIYRVIPDKDAARDGDIRVVDESGEDYLYPADWFVPIQPPSKVKASMLAVAGS
jgi:hypothetical protein